jgi:hypothetical protein
VDYHMERVGFEELLAAYGDQLNQHSGGALDINVPYLSAQEQQELESLLRLAAQIKEALAPVSPSSSYKQKLRVRLTEMARQRKSQDVVVELGAQQRQLLVGAAIGSAVALAGGIAYLIRARHQARS